MSDSSEHSDLWHWPTLILWSIFFLIGLFPEYVYYTLRALAEVPTYKAFVNSYHIIPLGLSTYLYLFTYRRGIEAELTRVDAHGKALQIGVLGLLAFLPVSEVFLAYQDISRGSLRNLVLGVGTAKLVAWIYLYIVLVRYYCFDGVLVYRRMRSVFPSTARAAREREQASAERHAEK